VGSVKVGLKPCQPKNGSRASLSIIVEERKERELMVLVVDKRKRPCNTISAAYARILLFSKQAVIHKRFPFTIRLRNDNAVLKDRNYTIKLDPDPGSIHGDCARNIKNISVKEKKEN